MGFKEDNKEKYLNPFKRIIVKVKTSLNGITVSAEVVGNRIRISVPKDKSGNLTGTLVENIALENSTWIFEPVDDDEIENRIDKALHPRKHMDLSKFDIEKGILPKEELEDLFIPVQYRKDYSPFAKRVLEHPREDVRKSAIEHIEDEDVIAAIVLYSNNKKISLLLSAISMMLLMACNKSTDEKWEFIEFDMTGIQATAYKNIHTYEIHVPKEGADFTFRPKKERRGFLY